MNPELDKLIYTLGTSTRSPKEFIELLSSHGVEVVVDVRRFPFSRFEHFRKRTAIICAERFPWRCHRRFITLELEKRGWQVSHIIDKGRNWVPRKRSANDKQLKLT